MLTGERAAAILHSLEAGPLVCEAEEIEELLALGLAVEADPEDLRLLEWLQPIVQEHAECGVDSPTAAAALEVWIADTNQALTSDWYRVTTSNAAIAERELARVSVRRALALLRDTHLMARLVRLVTDARMRASGLPWIVCDELGVEQYAATIRGRRVLHALDVRMARFAHVGFKSFVHAFDKAEQKMRAFGGEIATLSDQVGVVRKNREHVIIGLAKMGVSTKRALSAYHGAMAQVRAADVAVTCARNAETFGGPVQAAQRLDVARHALRSAGYPNTPIVMGCAKSLLAFEPPAAGVPRFTELIRGLAQLFGQSDTVFKFAVRLMPASGDPSRVLRRVATAGELLNQHPSRVARPPGNGPCAVALAAMVDKREALEPLVVRYRKIEARLVKRGVSQSAFVEADALECIACAGTPAEVVDTVATLLAQLSAGRSPHRGDMAIAAAFAKRFAY